MVTVFFIGVNMQGEKKKSWKGKTLEKLMAECKTPEGFEKLYKPIKELEKDILGLGRITFSLNLKLYFGLDDVINKAEENFKRMKVLYQKLPKDDTLYKHLDRDSEVNTPKTIFFF